MSEFGLTDKIFAVTLDNASSNTTAMESLSPLFSVYAASFLMHQRCACHIINLIAKCAMKICKKEIEILRTAISFLGNSTQRISSYKRYCIAIEQTPHKYNLDMPVRWNSTYMMLKAVIRDEVTFSGWINANMGREHLSDDTWAVAKALCKFLELFYDATITLSGVYYPTSPLMMHTLLDIATHLQAFEKDRLLMPMVSRMKLKYCKYWANIPILYAFAFILDPRVKLEVFASALSLLTGALGIDYIAYSTEVRDKLTQFMLSTMKSMPEFARNDLHQHQPQEKRKEHGASCLLLAPLPRALPHLDHRMCF